MKTKHIAIGALLTMLISGVKAGQFIKAGDSGSAVSDQYIVVFKDSAIQKEKESLGLSKPKKVVSSLNAKVSNAIGATVIRSYENVIKGGVYRMNEGQARALSKNPNIKLVEQDQRVTISSTQNNPTWGLDRIDQRNLPLSGSFTYTNTGSGVNAYVIDTGIYTGHSDFGGRAFNGYDFVDNDSVANDCHGHGTHVAGTIGSNTYGVAKNVNIYGVKVLDCDGRGTASDVIAGMDWVANNHAKPAVANMSLGMPVNTTPNAGAMEISAEGLVDSGVTVVVAAGNFDKDACLYTPAEVDSVITVGSTTSSDSRSGFSNYGSCLDVFAPGSNIESTWNNGGTEIMSGTSMASPHVAGIAALYLQNHQNMTPSVVTDFILTYASKGKLSGIGSGSPNLLAYYNYSEKPVMDMVYSEYAGCEGYSPRYILSWAAHSPSSVLEYDVDYSYNYGSWYNLYSGTSTGKMFYGSSNTTTKIRVRARNTNGWSSFKQTILPTISCGGGGPIIE